jgi:CRISPR-associated protein Cmr6
MPFLNLFKVPKTITKESLIKDFCQFGEVHFVFLKDDDKDNSVNFGSVDFITLSDKDGLFKYLKKKRLGHSSIRDSRDNRGNPSKCTGRRQQSQENLITNPSFYFYKHSDYGKSITDFIWSGQYNDLFAIDGLDPSQTFCLTTTYPGLLIGSGYNHPVIRGDGRADDEGYHLGFVFDHTTGLPIIPGSSIKGLLRSIVEQKEMFEGLYGGNADQVMELFEDNATVFYDAYIVGTHRDNHGKIFGSDYITTHHSDEEMGAFMDPTPIKFLKILPEVTWQFQFEVKHEIGVELFKKIILDFGLGAKTNVGYGQFRE